MQGANNTYWGNIKEATLTLLDGLKLSIQHVFDARKKRETLSINQEGYFEQDKGIVTLQYPHETINVPDNGRYKLHNEIDDCIVCDKCAKICPVDCIDIEPIRSPEEIGKTSDGTSKRIYAAKFDIDMGKCCFCGLCTTVCPTECLTMTKEYDFSVFNIAEHNFVFSDMTPKQIDEKKKVWEDHSNAKAQAKETVKNGEGDKKSTSLSGAKPVFKPKMKPSIPRPKSKEEESQEGEKKEKPIYRPKPIIKKKDK